MKIEIWADVICPWCGIGQHRLDRAVAGKDIEVVHRSFQLDPRAPETPITTRELLARKYGMREPQLSAAFERVESIAAADGITPYIVGDNLAGNTRLLHELLAMASERGHGHAAWMRAYRAYFGERRPIFDLESVLALAPDVGLDPDEARRALTDGTYRDRVEADGRAARELGSTGVPFTLIDGTYAIPGAQPLEVFEQAITAAAR